MAAAKVLARPTMTFIYVSGAGAQEVYVFRPGMIQPLHGIKSRTRLYNVLYPLLYPLIIVAKRMTPRLVTTTERVGQAMLRISRCGFPKKVLANPDINAVTAGFSSNR